MQRPALLLAPMDGLTDAPMRAVMGELGAFTGAVSEFVRVSTNPVPVHVFHREVPELLTGGLTSSGLPVQVQLLGGDSVLMAESAQAAVEAGANSLDINFGCPAPTVNRHDGGATILRYPARIKEIVAAVRRVVPSQIPVSAKLRLGWSQTDEIHRNAAMAAEGGADWLVVHARTKEQRYQPPVDWEQLGRLRRNLDIPLVANGDIWNLDDFRRCREVTGCSHFMLGRGAMARPALAAQIAHELGLEVRPQVATTEWVDLLGRLSYYGRLRSRDPQVDKTLHRLKQWLSFARRYAGYELFDLVKRAPTQEQFFATLRDPNSAPEVFVGADRG